MLILFLFVVPAPDGIVHLDTHVIEHAVHLETWAAGGAGDGLVGDTNNMERRDHDGSVATTVGSSSSNNNAAVHVREVVCKPPDEDEPGFTPTIIFVAGLEVSSI